MREKVVVNICTTCVHDCNVDDRNFTKCENFEKGLSCEEYWNLLKEHNINISKMCDNFSLKRNMLYKMLNGKMRFKYKYAKTIHMVIEKRTYIPDISMAEAEEKGGESN